MNTDEGHDVGNICLHHISRKGKIPQMVKFYSNKSGMHCMSASLKRKAISYPDKNNVAVWIIDY